ncbi:extracellular solute-binding protein [Paenibacillus koleovorans]|uniref:extracellular solute-binding protein n=1 Tax=Paenibacillus koleovorans TaxID=121608 RepID=UPI001FEAF460|nr:extracellular solute-binding protein [Paenibacillus koleovorans]
MKWMLLLVLAAAIPVAWLLYTRWVPASPPPSKPRLTVLLKMGDAFKSQNNPYIAKLSEELGIELEIMTVPASSYNERLDVLMASGREPDIIQLGWSGEENFPGWARTGRLAPIQLDQAPNIQLNVTNTLLSLMKVGSDDQVYGVPGVTTSYPYGVIVRKDWLDKLGLTEPRTLADFELAMAAFVARDPDGNGRNDTFGITSWRLNEFGGVFGGAFQTDYLWNTLHPDAGSAEAVQLREQQAGYPALLQFARQAYEKQWLDPDFLSLSRPEQKFILGKIGLIGAYSNETVQLEKELQAFVPGARLEWLLGPSDEEGRIWNFAPESYGYNGAGSMMGANALFAITKNAPYETALAFLDKMNTREMIQLSNLGVKGVHYESYDSNRSLIVRTEAQNAAVKRDLFGISDTFRGESLARVGDNATENERLQYYRKKGQLLITNPVSYSMGFVPEAVRFSMTHPAYAEQARNAELQVVVGSLPLAQLQETIKRDGAGMRSDLRKAVRTRYAQLLNMQK